LDACAWHRVDSVGRVTSLQRFCVVFIMAISRVENTKGETVSKVGESSTRDATVTPRTKPHEYSA
jgi:hypothetical protein